MKKKNFLRSLSFNSQEEPETVIEPVPVKEIQLPPEPEVEHHAITSWEAARQPKERLVVPEPQVNQEGYNQLMDNYIELKKLLDSPEYTKGNQLLHTVREFVKEFEIYDENQVYQDRAIEGNMAALIADLCKTVGFKK